MAVLVMRLSAASCRIYCVRSMRDGMAVATPWDLPLRLIRAFMLVITLIFGIS